MLSLMILLAAAPQSATPERPWVQMPVPEPRSGTEMPVLGQSVIGCPPERTTVNDPIRPGGGLTWRQGDQPVGHYLLLERRVDGCPAPIIVNFRVPGSNAVGRELRPSD